MTKNLIANAERNLFSERLAEAMLARGLSPSPSVLAREFNPRADGASVTVHGARKWLMGQAVPTIERVHLLARWLNISPTWLLFGEGPQEGNGAANDPAQLPTPEVHLLNDFRLLDERSQQVVVDLVASLLKHHSLRS
jgi:transcriptional regulator with XRE-family HTH domain